METAILVDKWYQKCKISTKQGISVDFPNRLICFKIHSTFNNSRYYLKIFCKFAE